jgi:hypothetical protein
MNTGIFRVLIKRLAFAKEKIAIEPSPCEKAVRLPIDRLYLVDFTEQSPELICAHLRSIGRGVAGRSVIFVQVIWTRTL